VVADFGYDRAGATCPGRAAAGWPGPGLPAISRELVAGYLAVTGGLAPVTGRIDGELRLHARSGPRVKVLTELPGAVQFTALVMLAEIGDITRFPSARKLASQSGLTPAVRGSDLHVRHGHIAKRRGTKIATIAISRKLLTRAWHLLSEIQAADASTPSRRP